MRRSELAGAEARHLNLDRGTLTIEPTRVVVDGKPIDEDGKTRIARRIISIDPYTTSVLREHVEMLDAERRAWGLDYPQPGKLFCFEDGRPLHPDTITRRFNRLVDKTGLPRITLHGVRHSYATVATDGGMNPKILSERIGQARGMGTSLGPWLAGTPTEYWGRAGTAHRAKASLDGDPQLGDRGNDLLRGRRALRGLEGGAVRGDPP